MADEDVRQRRAEKVRKEKMKGVPGQVARYLPVAAVLVLFVVGIGWAATHQPVGKKFVHEHAAWAVFIDGQQVTFRDPAYDMGQNSDRLHMHIGENGGGSIWHIESAFPGGVPDVTLAQGFAQYGMTLQQGDLKLDTKSSHNGSEWRDDGNATLRVYLSKFPGESRAPFEPLANYTGYVFRNLDKMLITYGNSDPSELAREEAAVPTPPGEPASNR